MYEFRMHFHIAAHMHVDPCRQMDLVLLIEFMMAVDS